ncbi:unnamed protein product [Didymodactylos carnosus]|uniref:Uncharacterized protein n=1 Tax=Didymodactylos carnosus TaxID=1234261 RepID=A0A815FVY5_9BILA|nr:unnamed protein product [Didymodactylos carnosus]CAF1629758.1 unnamed protein product [Didymodactylos carnosus]CAF4181978.1 unnamed protein product [Didymodactylos carnosus]CAF4455179.1 unnamed protein product [Didymodactylos carnosus]
MGYPLQSINSIQSFMNTDDVFDIFKYDSPDLIEIKNKSLVLTYLTTLLRIKQQTLLNNNINNSSQQQISYELLNNNSLLKSLISWYEQNETINMNSNDNNKQLFLSSFIDNITNNLSKSKNNYR